MISLIAAVGNNWQLGLNGGLPWPKHADDMAWFRKITAGKELHCGAQTFYGGCYRLNGTLGRTVKYISASGIDIRKLGLYHFDADIFIIGGAKTYEILAPTIDQLYLSRIDYDGPADCHFPIEAFSTTQIKNAIWRDE